jgi:hypothetical protein
MIVFNHHQLPRPSRQPFAGSNGGSRILARANAEILVAMPNESSFLCVFFQKEATLMKKIRCNDFDAKPPGWRKSAKAGLSLQEHFVALDGVSSTRM